MSSLDAQPSRPKMRLSLQSKIVDVPIYAPADDVFNSQEAAEREALHPHFKHSRGQEPCDHYIYFKGIAWRVLNSHREDPTKAPLPNAAVTEEEEPVEDAPARVPRSLESIAIEEEKITIAQNEKYLRWCSTFTSKGVHRRRTSAQAKAQVRRRHRVYLSPRHPQQHDQRPAHHVVQAEEPRRRRQRRDQGYAVLVHGRDPRVHYRD
jgi:hypothetical protein